MGKEGCVPISTKNKYIIVDLTKFDKPKDKLKTDEDRWLYILKNAGSSSSLPEFEIQLSRRPSGELNVIRQVTNS